MAPRKLESLGHALAEMQDEALDVRKAPLLEHRVAGIRAVRLAMQARASLRRPAATGAALGLVASVAILWPRVGPLGFAVGEPAAPGEVGMWVAAPADAPSPIAFSDGSRVTLRASARARVVAMDDHGARVVVERGTVRVDVVPRAHNDWRIIGGPFEIDVTGTSFDTGWDPQAEVLHVTMREGRVVVRSACLDRERPLIAGETALLSCPRSQAVMERGRAPSANSVVTTSIVPPTAPTPAAEEPPPGVGRADSTSEEQPEPAEPTSVPATASWQALARRGDYKGALAVAEAAGFGALCDALPAADLFELATAARLAGRPARAKEAYSAVRRRFGGGDAAAKAAFHLGQMAFDGAHALAEARNWFTIYLAERPGGAYAAQALGRVMDAAQRTGDRAAAREAAAKYLSLYPTGVYAALAKSLMGP